MKKRLLLLLVLVLCIPLIVLAQSDWSSAPPRTINETIRFLATAGFETKPELVNLSFKESKELEKAIYAFKQEINPKAVCSVIVTPTRKWPGLIKDFPGGGNIIGTIFTSNSLREFRLNPGSYAIKLYRTQAEWKVDFLNKDGIQAGSATAKIIETKESFEEPKAFIEFSSPGIIICWDNTCVEF